MNGVVTMGPFPTITSWARLAPLESPNEGSSLGTNSRRIALFVLVGSLLDGATVMVATASAFYWPGLTCNNKGSGDRCLNGGDGHSWRTIDIHSTGAYKPGFCDKTVDGSGTNIHESHCISPSNTFAGSWKAHFDGTVQYAYGYWASGDPGTIDDFVNADTNVT